MADYTIEHRLRTLLHNAAGVNTGGEIESFEIGHIKFKQEGFDLIDGWTSDYWIATGSVNEKSGLDAINQFRNDLDEVVGALCLVGQAYTEYRTFSSLVRKPGTDKALFFYYQEQKGGNNLMLMPEHVAAVEKVLADRRDFSGFLRYWREITNTPDFIAKIILYCASLDALTKILEPRDWNNRKHKFRERILGTELKEKLYGTAQNSKDGLRHKIVHGELDESIFEISLPTLHRKITSFFNAEVLNNKTISSAVVSPQRNPYKNFSRIAQVIELHSDEISLQDIEAEYGEFLGSKKQLTTFKFLSPEENNRLAEEF